MGGGGWVGMWRDKRWTRECTSSGVYSRRTKTNERRAGQGMVKLVDVIGIRDWGWFGTMGRRMRTDSKYSTSRGQLIVA